MRRLLLCLISCGLAFLSTALGDEPSDQAANEAAIRKAAASYVEAFNKHDAQALADQWSPDAVYLNRTTGAEAVGREAIAKQFEASFKDQPGQKLDVKVASVQFVSPNVAIEQGTITIASKRAEPLTNGTFMSFSECCKTLGGILKSSSSCFATCLAGVLMTRWTSCAAQSICASNLCR